MTTPKTYPRQRCGIKLGNPREAPWLGTYTPPARIKPRPGSVPSFGTVPANPPPLRHCGLHAAHQALAARRRLPCRVFHHASARKAAPWLCRVRQPLSQHHDFCAVRAWVRIVRRPRRRPKGRPTASAVTSKQPSGALRTRGTNAGLG